MIRVQVDAKHAELPYIMTYFIIRTAQIDKVCELMTRRKNWRLLII